MSAQDTKEGTGLKEEIIEIKSQLKQIKKDTDRNTEEVGRLKVKTAVTDERVKTIFTSLNKIESGVEKLNASFEESRAQPSKAFWGILATVASGLILAAIKL